MTDTQFFKVVYGDLIDLAKQGQFDTIVHGCNCFNTMKAGIAKQIATAFPQASDVDFATKKGSLAKLGHFTKATVYVLPLKKSILPGHLDIINLYTQYQLGANFNIDAFRIGLYKLDIALPRYDRIGMPLIGGGIGRGNEEDIVKAINVFALNRDVTLVRWNKTNTDDF